MIYSYSHQHFEFAVYSSNLASRQVRHVQTLQKRGEDLPTYHVQMNGKNQPLEKPLFFENSRYEFEWAFFQNVQNVEVKHSLNAVNENFRFNARTQTLSGIIDTANDVGWFYLPISYKFPNGATYTFEFAFEVLPSKMDLHSDLPEMYKEIDATYQLWRFNLAEKTDQSFGENRERVDFSLLWLAQFQRLQEDFAKALNIITNSPHNRLQSVEKYQKAERIKGKIPERIAMKICNDMQNGLFHKHYAISEKHLSVDTPENRFVKMTVQCSLQILNKFDRTLRKNDEKHRLSDAFFARLEDWQKPLRMMKNQTFMQQVREFQGLMKESLVLQQRSGYSRVFQIWQELKHYLDLFEHNHAEISQKSVAEIYEVWCFLALRRCLLELGFVETTRRKAKLIESDDFSLTMQDGVRGAFHFQKDGIKIRLAHEAKFNKANKTIRSFIVPQKPDIYLEITFPNKQRYIWLFDAKYRIKTEKEVGESDDIEHIDYVPDDAINQMHRYRDALILLDEKRLNPKSRPVFGAFALYPGFFNQQAVENPYKNAIEQVGIGAFALLPSEDGSHSYWLKNFLKEHLQADHLQDNLLLQHEARIADHGMIQTRYNNLVLMMGVGLNRSAEYMQKVENGKLAWYHTPVTTFELKYPDYIAAEIRFLALAYKGEIARLYPVKGVTKLKRIDISFEQSGSDSQSEAEYYLFELAKPLWLEQPICNVPEPDMQGKGFTQSIKLVDLEQLDEVNDFARIISVLW